MRTFILNFTMLLPLFGCATVADRASETADRDAEIETLRTELRRGNAQITTLQTDIDQLETDRGVALAKVSDLGQQIGELEAQLQDSNSTASSEEVEQILQQLTGARDSLLLWQGTASTYEAQNEDLRFQLDGARDNLDDLDHRYSAARLMAMTANVDPASVAENATGLDLDSDSPIAKKVFYATNRIRLVRNWTDYLKHFYIPLLLALGFLLLSAAVKRYVKEIYQLRARIIVFVFTLIPALVLGLVGIQKSVQMRDADGQLFAQYGNDIRIPAPGEPAYERGVVEVSIPPHRKLATVSRPELVKFEFAIDPSKHFKLTSIEPSTQDGFYDDITAEFLQQNSKDMFVFVHGFHNTFEDAAFRTAQIAHDMGFNGVPLFFSWPSQGTVLNYLTDAANVETSVVHLREFLEELHQESGATTIHMIAHSMGSRALSKAIEHLDQSDGSTDLFGQLVFAAPDMPKSDLVQKAEELNKRVDRVTVYASSHDSALQLSRVLQGQTQNYQRAGETWPSPMVAPPIQTVDVSIATRGHSYISTSTALISDLRALLQDNRPLSEQSENFVPSGTSGGYWVLQSE